MAWRELVACGAEDVVGQRPEEADDEEVAEELSESVSRIAVYNVSAKGR